MTIIEFPPEPLTRHTSQPIARLPRRFDVHQVENVTDELRRLGVAGARVELDGSLVEMVDLHALAALATVATEIDLRITSPSVAMRATVDYTGHTALAGHLELHSDVRPAIAEAA